MRRHASVLFLWVLVSGLLLVACGGGDDSNNNNNNISSDSLQVTLPPLGNRTILDGCTDEMLDDWTDRVYFNVEDFADDAAAYARRADGQRRNEIQTGWENLVALRESAYTFPTPQCLEATHLLAIRLMQAIIDDFQRFSNAETTAETFQEDVQPDIDALEDLKDSWTGLLTQLYATN